MTHALDEKGFSTQGVSAESLEHKGVSVFLFYVFSCLLSSNILLSPSNKETLKSQGYAVLNEYGVTCL